MSTTYPSAICYDCGEKHGHRIPTMATWYLETCDICGDKASCTQPRDFGHLKPGWEEGKTNPQPEIGQ